MKNSVPLFLLLLVCGSANAALYSCADKSGNKVLRSWPCEEEQPHLIVRVREVRPIKWSSMEEKRAYNFRHIKVGMSVEEVSRIMDEKDRLPVAMSAGSKSEVMVYETGSTREDINLAIREFSTIDKSNAKSVSDIKKRSEWRLSELERIDGLASKPGYIYVTNGKVVSIQQTRH